MTKRRFYARIEHPTANSQQPTANSQQPTANSFLSNIAYWQEKYESFVANSIPESKQCISDFLSICKNKRIVLWGANMHGKTIQRLLTDIGLKIDRFVDRNYAEIKNLNGVEVLAPQWLSTVQDDNTIVIASVNMKNYLSIKDDIKNIAPQMQINNGFLIHYPLQSAVCFLKVESGTLEIQNCSCCTKVNQTCPILKNNLIKNGAGKINNGGADITLIGCILGTICSLNCKHCVEHVPYIPKRDKHFQSYDSIINDIQALAAACEFVTILDFVGGEPFLHPELPKIIREVRKIDNIGIVNVFTNGTIMPSEELIAQLEQNFVTIDLSNYSVNLSPVQQERIIATEKTLKDAGVIMFQAKNFTWSDTLSFKENKDNKNMLIERYNNCSLKDCYRLYDGKLFRCLHHYAGYITGNIPIDDSVVIIHEKPDTLVERLKTFIALPFIEACNYCDMPFNSKTVSSGIQL